jgi:predicted nucleotidyltransferase
MDPRSLLKRIRSLLESAYGSRLQGVVLYGSVARGSAGPDSDIDVLVILDKIDSYGADLRKNIEALYPLAAGLDCRISAKPVAQRDYDACACPLYRRARHEGIAA